MREILGILVQNAMAGPAFVTKSGMPAIVAFRASVWRPRPSVDTTKPRDAQGLFPMEKKSTASFIN
jgi:hypothetical protein